jgi:hypothetical protein
MKKILFGLIAAIYLSGCGENINGELMFIEPDNKGGFNYPYYLFVPDGISSENKLFLIVEPNNTGTVSDDLDVHAEKARRTATIDYYIGNYLARNLHYPLLVPVFPRPESNWTIYTHSLDRDVMLQKGNTMERIDLQLLAMAHDAMDILAQTGHDLQEKILLSGFSASGTFANRFTLIHPNHVAAVAAGGLNGFLTLPIGELNGEKLNYPIGIGDFQSLLKKDFDTLTFKNTPQYYFMGELDENDALPYQDAYDEEERVLIFDLLGEEMLPARWNKCREIYHKNGIHAQIITYSNIGHEHPERIKEDILLFFQNSVQE